jgi:hypothetical protein
MPPKKENSKDKPKQKKTANGADMALKVPLGEVMTDVSRKKWVVGPPIGQGGFGTIYSGTYFINFYPLRGQILQGHRSFLLIFGVTLLMLCCLPSLLFKCLLPLCFPAELIFVR